MQFMTIEYISFVDEFYAEKQSVLFGDPPKFHEI